MRGIYLEDNLVSTIRIICITLTLLSTIKINQYSTTLFFITIGIIIEFYFTVNPKTNVYEDLLLL